MEEFSYLRETKLTNTGTKGFPMPLQVLGATNQSVRANGSILALLALFGFGEPDSEPNVGILLDNLIQDLMLGFYSQIYLPTTNHISAPQESYVVIALPSD